ncbi:hypothetical protein ABPG75_006383 [Micractinium tetrahymenae]
MEGRGSGVFYRPLCPSDYAALKLLHQRLFPLDYDDDFFVRAVHGMDGIVAWSAAAPLPALTHIAVGGSDLAPQLLPAAACPQREQLGQIGSGGCSSSGDAPSPELLAGFITGKPRAGPWLPCCLVLLLDWLAESARAFQARYADPRDRELLGVAGQQLDEQRLLYVLTLGVAEASGAYQRQGIARRLLDFALKYAAETACRAVYLHVATFNQAARAFYARAGFRELALLPDFYIIRTGRQPQPGRDRYDACLLGCTLQPVHPTPWGTANLALSPLTAGVNGMNTCMAWRYAGQREQDDVAAANAAIVPAAGGVRVIEIVEEGRVEQPAAGPALHQPLLGPAAGQPQQPAPEWLKSLFKRG